MVTHAGMQHQTTAAATECLSRDLIHLDLHPELCSQIRWGKIASTGAFDRKIFLFFSTERFPWQIWKNPERMSWVQFMLKGSSHLPSDGDLFLSVGMASRQNNKSFTWK